VCNFYIMSQTHTYKERLNLKNLKTHSNMEIRPDIQCPEEKVTQLESKIN